MTGQSIGAQAIGFGAAAAARQTSAGQPAVFAAQIFLAAPLSPAAAAGALYVPGQSHIAIIAPHTNTAAIWAATHRLHISTHHDSRKDDSTMYTHIHGNIETRSGERAELVFSVTDKDGNAADLTDAAAEYRLARRAGDTALLTCHSEIGGGITIADNIVTVSFDTGTLTQAGKALLGDFFAQLRITVDERTLVVAEGPISIAPVILPTA